MRRKNSSAVVAIAAFAAIGLGTAAPAFAGPFDEVAQFSTDYIKDYLIISKSNQGLSTAVSVTTTGNTLGHVVNLAPSAAPLPAGVPSPVTADPTFDGDTAILTNNNANFNYQDLNVFGDVNQGVVCANTTAACSNNGSNISNSNFDNGDGNGLQPIVAGRGIEQFSAPDLANFTNEVNAARSALQTLRMQTPDQNIDLSSNGGKISSDTFITLSNVGLNLIVFDDVGGDILIENSSLVFDAPDDATPGDRQAIVFLPDSANLLTSNGNILVGENLGLMDVVFVSFREDNASHFNFSNTILNGVAFWDLARAVGDTSDPSEHVWNNVTGCTQLLGDKINLSSEIHLSNCGFRGISYDEVTEVPEPGTLALMSLGLVGLGFANRRKRASS